MAGRAKLWAALAAVAAGVGALVPVAARLASPAPVADAAQAPVTTDARGTAISFSGSRPTAVAGAAVELEPIETTPALGGTSATRYQQLIDGVPVVGGEVSVQVGPDGRVLSSLSDVSDARTVDTTPAVSADEARRRALASVDGGVDASSPELWVYDASVIGPPSSAPAQLTWRLEVTGDALRQFVLVDAHTGRIALSFSEVAHALDRRVCDGTNARGPEPCTSPVRTEGQGPIGRQEVDRVYDTVGLTYAFYQSHFGRDGIDGAGSPILAKVRFCPQSSLQGPCPYDNAFWNGSQLTFGDGYAVDDVVAHELTHGVTEHSANLFYWYQSGAINESMSDVFGELVDQADGWGTDTPAVRWLIGEDLTGGALRSMSDPPAFGDPDRMTSASYTADSAMTDAGGVHTNSGVGNKTAFLITDGGSFNGHTVVGLGANKAAAVYYEALTTLLTSGSDYADLGVALHQACANLVTARAAGLRSTDCQQVDEAVAATELALGPTTPGAQAPEAPVCATGTHPVDLFADDLEDTASGQWARTHTMPGLYDWVWPGSAYTSPYATSGTSSFLAIDTGDPWGNGTSGSGGEFGESTIAMAQSVALPAGVPVYARFRHAWDLEVDAQGKRWDGGIVELSVTDGASWQDLGLLPVTNGYNGTLVSGGSNTNPLGGKPAFSGNSHGYRSTRADLSSLAGQSVRLRFHFGENKDGGTINRGVGWFVDDVAIYACEPLEVSQTVEQESVVAGEAVDVHVTVHNTGGTALAGVQVTDTEATECDRTIPTLAAGESTTINCTHATVSPDDVGTWINVVSVTAAGAPVPVTASASVDVAARAPALTATLEATPSSVTAGDEVSLSLVLENTGNVALTGVTVTDAGAPDCAGPVTDLAVAGSTTVECRYTTVDPSDIGKWTNTALVAATELGSSVTSNQVSVDVMAPETPGVSISQTADETTVTRGSPVHLHLTVTNTGNVALSNVTIADTDAPACASVVGGLAVGANATINCSATPPALGTWSNAASVTSEQTSTPAGSNTVEVAVTDGADPSVVLTTPADGQVVDEDEVVPADYSCADDEDGSGLRVSGGCVGDVPDGAAVETSTVGPHTFTVTATDAAGNSAEVSHTYTVAGRQPDGRVRRGTQEPLRGDGIYNLDGASQTRTGSALPGRTVTYFVSAQNDGSLPQALAIRGQRSTSNFTVRYFTAGTDITSDVTHGTYETPVLAVGVARTIKVAVTVRASAPLHATLARLITITSMEDAGRTDVVKVVTNRR